MLTLQLAILTLAMAFELFLVQRSSGKLRIWAKTIPVRKRILIGCSYLSIGLLTLFGCLAATAMYGGVQNGAFHLWAFFIIIVGSTVFIGLQTLAISLFVSHQIGDVTDS